MRAIPVPLLLTSLFHFCCTKTIDRPIKPYIPADTLVFVQPERRPIILTGSSTVALWPDSSFASFDVIRVGRGGYHFGEMLRGSARKPAIVWDSLLLLRPRQWVLQGGDNDIYYKRPLHSIKADVQKIVTRLIAVVPDLRVDFIYAKPTGPNEKVVYNIDSLTVNGWTATETMNTEIATWGLETFPENFHVLNAYDPLLLSNPKRLDVKYFQNDLVHLNNDFGYRLLDSLLRPRLLRTLLTHVN